MRACLTMIATAISLSVATIAAPALAQAPVGPLRVGAMKVDITPAASDLPTQYRGVLDPAFSRAIVVDNGTTAVAFVTIDSLSVSDALAHRLASRISTETGIAADHLIIAGTGTHSVPAGMRDAASPAPSELAWEAAVARSVVMAKARMQPARMTYGSGRSWINVQRDRIDPATGRWWEGPNYEGVSDKEVAVMSFVSDSGEPLAAYYNYGVFNVITGMQDMVSGDVTGASSKYIEDATGPEFVAALGLGPHGDQNPIFFNQTFELRDIRIADYAARGEDIRIAMPPPAGVGLNRDDPRVARLMEQQRQINAALGLMLGEEVLRVMRDAPDGEASVGIYAAQTTVSCPGRRRTNQGRGGVAGTYEDADPVQISLGLTMIGDVAIGAVNGAPYAAIGLRLKAESPFSKTMLVTRANGYAPGYIPDDASYGHETFAVLNARLKPGCAEGAVVNGILGLMPPVRY